MKKLRYIIPLIIIFALLVTPLITLAQGQLPQKAQERRMEVEYLRQGEVRLDQHTVARKIGERVGPPEGKGPPDGKGPQRWEIWETTISTIPQTLPDLKTKITIEWRRGVEPGGAVYFETGNNIYYSKVTGTRVFVEYEGPGAAWNPILYLGKVELVLKSGPELVGDPLVLESTLQNTIKWVYEAPRGLLASLFGGQPIQVTRYLRQIEGNLQELYMFMENPNRDFRVVTNYQEEAGFIWTGQVYGFDSRYIPFKVEGNHLEKFVDTREFGKKNLTYPVYVDPSQTFTKTNTWTLHRIESAYYDAWIATTAGTIWGGTFHVGVADPYVSYQINRGFATWDTSGLPSGITITNVDVKLKATYKDFNEASTWTALQIQSGMPTYPQYITSPYSKSDYDKGYYSGSGLSGTDYFGDFPLNDWYYATMTSTGRSWINTSGYTKLVFRSAKEILGSEPTGKGNNLWFSQDVSLIITYESPVTKPIVDTRSATSIAGTSSTLRGELTNDGGTDCTVSFEYGTTTAYGYNTSPISGQNTGYTWETPIYGLEYGTLYHYTAKAQNSGYYSDDDNETFLTKPNKVTSFSATAGSEHINLAWTKGTGSDKTLVRFSTSGYPSTPTSGTQVYFDTGVSYNHTSLTNGTTYYYSVWAEQSSGGYQQYSADKVTANAVPVTSGPPVVTTNDATAVGQTTATLHGNLDSLGGHADADVWFQYYWGAGTWTDNETTPVEMTSTGPITPVAITSLPTGTLIYFRAAASGDGGTAYGGNKTFTTGAISAPTMETTSSGGLTGTSATLYGKVTASGGASVTADFQWGLTTSLGEITGPATGLVTGDTYQVTLTGLDYSTTYYFRSRGWNTAGTGYGVTLNFTTESPTAPAVTTLAATGVGSTSATAHGTLTADGGVPCEVRFQWSDNATLSDNVAESGWQPNQRVGDPSFNHYISGLSTDTIYYFRAQAKNSAATVNGTILNFTTLFLAPTGFIASPLSSTEITLSWTSQADRTLVRGKQGSYPTDRLDGSQVYFGVGESITHGSLLPGTTYFYRAWSWQGGGTYSASYVQDAATTLSGTPLDAGPSTPFDDMDLEDPEAPSGWWTAPSSDNIQSWPGVDLIDSIAGQIGMPVGTMWALIAGGGAVLLGTAAFFILGTPIALLIGGGFALIMLNRLGTIPGWFLILFVILAGAIIIVWFRRES